MTLIQLKPFVVTSGIATGITIAQCLAKAGQYIRFGFSAEAQQQFFGGPLDPAKDALSLSIEDDAKLRHLLRVTVTDYGDDDAIAISGGIKGSVSLKLAPWMQLAPGKRPAERLALDHKAPIGSVMVKLPEWARPPIQKPGFGRSIMET